MNIRETPADIHQQIRQMAEFTELYRSFSEEDIAAREAACLAQQFGNIMLAPEPGDILAGRMKLPPVGFAPQPILEKGQGEGYYCDEELLAGWRENPELNAAERRALDHLIAFWHTNTSKARTEKLYTDDQKTFMTHGNYRTLPGVAYPLYRIGGVEYHFTRLMEQGLSGLRGMCNKNLARNPSFFDAADKALVLMQNLCTAYADLAMQKAEACISEPEHADLLAMSASLRRLATGSPVTFRDAVQLTHLYTLVSGCFNYGRMDEYLTPFYTRGIGDGSLTKAEAKRILKDLWKHMRVRNLMMDARVIVGGLGREACDPQQADEFALVVMEVSREVKEPLPQLSLMCYQGMNPALWEKAMEMLGEGTTYPILYNDDVNIPAVEKAFKVPEAIAKTYVPFGCGEYVLYHKSFGTPSGTINLLSLLNRCLDGGYRQNHWPFQKAGISALEYYRTFEEFYAYYLEEAGFATHLLALQQKQEYDACGAQAAYLYYSLLYEDCIETAQPLLSGGVRYLGGTLESYGNTNAADSLTAVKTLVYEQNAIRPRELINALKANFVGHEELREKLLSAPKFGNDDGRADSVASRLHEDICAITRSQAEKVGLHSYLIVVINNRTNTFFGLTTGASADGRLANTFMANANNPTGGMDRSGLTAMLNSLLKLRPDLHAGAVQNMRFSKDMFGPLLPKTESILHAYFENGGTQSMITVLGRDDLENAIRNPDAYRDLIVRVGGFSARFVELSPPVQQELLSRTLY